MFLSVINDDHALTLYTINKYIRTCTSYTFKNSYIIICTSYTSKNSYIIIYNIKSRFNGTVEWNSGTVEWWNSGMVEEAKHYLIAIITNYMVRAGTMVCA